MVASASVAADILSVPEVAVRLGCRNHTARRAIDRAGVARRLGRVRAVRLEDLPQVEAQLFGRQADRQAPEATPEMDGAPAGGETSGGPNFHRPLAVHSGFSGSTLETWCSDNSSLRTSADQG